MNKRGGSFVSELFLWVPRIIVVIAIVLSVALDVRTAENARISTEVAEPALLAQVLGSSPAFLARDQAGAAYRVIDVLRFKNAQDGLNRAIAYRQRRAAARLTLFEYDGTRIATLVLDPDYYDELAPQAAGPLLGKTVLRLERQWPMRLLEAGSERPGILRVEVLQPR